MSLSTWTRDGSEKAQASQTIRILMKTLQYLAEDAVQDDANAKSFSNIAATVIKGLFNPSPQFSNNEQVSVLFNSLGWKNAQIKFSSGKEAQIILGSNRHLDQDQNSEKALSLLVSTLSKALGFHILSREVDVVVNIDILSGPIYTIDLRAITSTIAVDSSKSMTGSKQSSASQSEVRPPVSSGSSHSEPASQTPTTASAPGTQTNFESDQIFLPVLSNRLPLGRLQTLLQDVLAEFSQSWYGANPLDGNESGDPGENVSTLIQYLTEKAIENNTSTLDGGIRLGSFYAHAIKQTFANEDPILAQEIIDGASVGSMIRDIKARAFCNLRAGEKCGPNIGDSNRAMCDFSMGIWQGTLSELSEKQYTFTGFYPAGKRDPYCLMEFNVE